MFKYQVHILQKFKNYTHNIIFLMNKKQTSNVMALVAVAATMFAIVAVVATPVQIALGAQFDRLWGCLRCAVSPPDACGWSDCSPDALITSNVHYAD
jgi:hypothetical protein